ncbi:type IVB secretion system protein IcmH/DotU [Entomomonas sp. E2T0]|uniref:type IVB secretion system protein IcmH/DotU n=1 Tax=Entomomonas sp. E2T0 TaxID=2930213 RepID=UPI0022282948|nr:type IVB secretion system protein IcmH/DotU [Entomomonas sp. E2T0]UYZ84360.1 type IVB secretion system protein IcmH/DotU [Entomomonas sp. E2T0]
MERDDKTVISSRFNDSNTSSVPLLTDISDAPNYASLDDKMVFAARLRPVDENIVGLNPLISAGAHILSEVVRLRNNAPPEDLESLQHNYIEAIKRFERIALQSGVENSQVMSARYVMCTVLDEAVVCTSWGVESAWAKYSLLASFHNETFGGEKVFQLLDRITRNPVKYLPLIELIYVCLSLGFEGKYRVMNRGTLELEAIRDSLYRQIKQLRGDVPKALSPQWQGLQPYRRGLIKIVPWWMVVIFTIICLVIMYSGFAFVLNQERKQSLEPYHTLDTTLTSETKNNTQ